MTLIRSVTTRLRRIPRRTVLAWCGGGVVGVMLAAAALVWLWPALFKGVIEEQVANVIGGDVSIGGMHWDGGDLVLEDVSVTVPDISGPAAEALDVHRMRLDMSLWDITTPETMVRSVHVESARLLIAGAQDPSQGPLNVSLLGRRSGGGGQHAGGDRSPTDSAPAQGNNQTPPVMPPDVTVDAVDVIVGTWAGDTFVQTGQAQFSAALQGTADGLLVGDLTELGVADGLVLSASGSLTRGSGAIHAEHLQLNERTEGLIPLPGIRQTVDALHLSGAVPFFSFEFDGEQPVSAELVLDDLSLKLDDQLLGLHSGRSFWRTFRAGQRVPSEGAPVMQVNGGRVMFDGDTLRIVGLEGVLHGPQAIDVSVPWQVDLAVDDVVSLAQVKSDVDGFLAAAPFHLRLAADDVVLKHGQTAVLPRIVARIMEMFGVQAGRTSIELTASRSTPDEQAEVSGIVRITEAEGAYERFPYPLHDLTASIEFDLDRVRVHDLHASGRGASTIHIQGEVDPNRGDDIALSLRAADIPVDAILLEAMPDVAAHAMADVLPAHADVPAPIAASAFSPEAEHADRVDLDLWIARADGGPVDISGQIEFDRLMLEWTPFPYAIVLEAGWFDWKGGHIALHHEDGEGTPFHTPDGAQGMLHIGIDLPPIAVRTDNHHVVADVRIDLDEQPLTPALVDAVHVLTSEGGAVLRSTALRGLVDMQAHVHIDGSEPRANRRRYAVDLRLDRGEAQVGGVDIGGNVTLADLFDHDIVGVHGGVLVTQDEITLDGLTLTHEGRTLVLDGHQPGHGETRVQGEALAVGQWMSELLPEVRRTEAAHLLHLWRPAGMFDIDGVLDANGDMRGVVSSIDVALTGLYPQVTVRQDGGTLMLVPGGVSCDELSLALRMLDAPVGDVRLQGEASPGAVAFDVTATAIDMQSPLMGDLIVVLGGQEAQALWSSFQPGGVLDLDASVTPGGWQVDARPLELALTRDGHRFSGRVESGSLQLSDRGIDLLDLLLVTPQGTQGSMDARYRWRGGTLDGRFAIDGALGGPLLGALGGTAWQQAMHALAYRDGTSGRLTGGRMHIADLGGSPTGTLHAAVSVEGASMAPGVDIEHMSARADLAVELQGDSPAVVRMEIADMAGDVGPVHVEGVQGVIERTAEGTIDLRDLAGSGGGGRLSVEGAIAPDTSWFMHVHLAGGRLESLAGAKAAQATGRVATSLHLAGDGSPGHRRGTGVFRIVDGQLGPLPAIVALQQLLHLSSPVVGEIDFVSINYSVHDDEIDLEDIRMEATSGDVAAFSLNGTGTMHWPDMNVDIRLKPRGSWPILSDVIGLLQDQLYAIEVKGDLVDPDITLAPLPGLTASK
ncbi:MAG: hypothetical protein MK074_00075 [Phycisphaerales bacterium]|nr:hypothetical protein [Phycisphaerales bacterium]